MQPEKDNDGLPDLDTVKPLLVFGIDLQGADPLRFIIIFRGILATGDVAVQYADEM